MIFSGLNPELIQCRLFSNKFGVGAFLLCGIPRSTIRVEQTIAT
jgi:hypothetical protein